MRRSSLGAGAAVFFALCAAAAAADLPGALAVPAGFRIATYADGVPRARELALGTEGTVFVGARDPGNVYALTDTDHDGVAKKVRVVAHGLDVPSGVAFHAGDLYIGALSRIYVLRDIEHHLDDPPPPELITDRLPKETHHGWKFLAFGPDGRLYVGIGAPCNICIPDKDHGKLISMRADGSDWRDVAVGIRNSVGFDWQPGSGKLWFTDNGRDQLGDDLPSDELNRVDREGQNFGYPYCHQGDTLDPELGAGKSCSDFVPPVLKLGAHVASIGMRFYTGSMFPSAFRGAAIIAEHGSWNRSSKSGYRVMSVRLDGGRAVDQQPLIDRFQRNEEAFGRPADVLVMPDGALLVSDDLRGAVYRLTYAP
jgi:glucose/arabinose dehydrogenase